jgi:pimeloyl-ACP methyl ester carboxylesterase
MPILKRPDGRRIAFEVSGDASDPLVVSIHGTPGSRVGTHPVVDGVRVLSFDRPGYGDSDPQPVRDVTAVAYEVAALADHLGVDRFGVFGISGGGPHALACAAVLPDRVIRVASLVGPAPWEALGPNFTAGMSESNVTEFAAAAEGRDALAALLDPGSPLGSEQIMEMLATELPQVDAVLLEDPAFRENLAVSITEGLRNGIGGWLDDDLAFVAPWGFDPATITAPTLIWHGTSDVLVPIGHARWLHQAIEKSELIASPGVGHLAAYAIQERVVRWLVDGTPL